MTLEASGTLETDVTFQYLHTLVHEELLRQFYTLSSDVESTVPLTVQDIILGLVLYFYPVNLLLNQKCAIRCGMRKPRGIKLRC